MSLFQEIKRNIPYVTETIGKSMMHYKLEGKSSTPTIIGIHGVFGSWTDGSVKDYLKDNNIGGVLTNFDFLLRGVDYYIPKLGEQIQKYPNSIVLGCSAGGIVALEYARRFGFHNIHKIITIGTPFNGVRKPFGVLGKSVREISPGSRLLKGVLSFTPDKERVLSVFAKNDYFTPSPETLKLNWPSAILDADSHSDLQWDRRWLEQILDAELGINKD
jgi:pimeloyl-ACP methyl ester carboxylesterase